MIAPRRLGALLTALTTGAVGAAVSILPATTATAADADPPACDALPFRDPSLPMSKRLDDLMGRLTLDEKIGLMHQYQQPVPRLCIGLFKAGTEALHGVAWSNNHVDNSVVTATATTFPQAVGMASTWDPALIQQVGSAVGNEARGMHARQPDVFGLNLWAPVVNLLRDPRWGRNEEGYSEDPTLTSAIATAYGSGIQGDDPTYLKAAPTLKHFLAYNNEVNRDTSSSSLTPRTLHEYDEQAFEPTLRADAATGVMASYNLVNGRPNTVSPMLNEIRDWSSRTLFNVSDAFAPHNLTGSEHYYATAPEADAAMFEAGIDSYVADDNNPSTMIADIKAALAQGLLDEATIDRVDRDALSIRFRLGEFDPDGGPYGDIDESAIDTEANRRLARKTAAEAMVLLKNDRRTLPLSTRTKSVAVIGQLEDTVYSDWYGGNPPYKVTPLQGIKERLGSAATVTGNEGVDRIALKDVATGKYVTATGTGAGDAVAATAGEADSDAQFDVFEWGRGIVTLRNAANGNVVGSGGGGFVTHDAQPNGWFVQQQFKIEPQPDGSVALRYAGNETRESWFGKNVYVTVGAGGKLVLGASTADAAAHFARETVSSGIDQAVAAARNAQAAVLVVGSMPFINGREADDRSSTALPAAQEALVKAVLAANPNTVLVLQTSYPDTITWEQQHVPAIVWTTHAGQETGHAMADVLFGDVNPSGHLTQTWYASDDQLPSILDYDIAKAGTTYLYHRGEELYPFGHGLSYTSFRYSRLHANRSAGLHGTINASVRVTNTGSRTGDDVVQLYAHQRTSRDRQPLQRLQAFQRVHLAPGRSKVVHFRVPVSRLAHWDVTRSRWVVESSTYDVRVGASARDLRQSAAVTVRGESIPPRDLTRPTEAENFDDYAGVTLVDRSKTDGTSVGATAGGQWVEYADAQLRSPHTFTARVSDAGAPTKIEIRLDSPTGPLLGTAEVASTGDEYAYTTVSAPLARVNGQHSVFLVLGDGVRLASFSLS